MINSHYTYLLVNLGAVIVPFLFSFHPKIQFYKKWKEIMPAIFLPMFLFLPWDMYFTRLGVWGFNPDYTVGIHLLNLPVEEVLFFICIPYCCLFTYHSLALLLFKDRQYPSLQVLCYTLASIAILVSLLFYERSYTFTTFFFLGCGFIWSGRFFADQMAVFFLSYFILLAGFFVVNGILTGTGPDNPVVWYNNTENAGVRILTIPLEDFFYGMLLILLNVAVFEKRSKRKV